MSKTAYKVAITAATAVAIFGFSGAAIADMDINDPSPSSPKEAMSEKAPTAPSTSAPEGEVPAPTIDTNKDGKPDAWDRDSNGSPDAWDKDGDNKPDLLDDDGDGRPDKKAKMPAEPKR